MSVSRLRALSRRDAEAGCALSSADGRAFGAILVIVGLAAMAIAGWRMFGGEPVAETPLAAAFLIIGGGIVAARQTSAQDLPDAR